MDFLFYLSTLPIWQKGLILLCALGLYVWALGKCTAWVDKRRLQMLPDEHENLFDFTDGREEQAEMHKALKYPKRRKAA